jgi:hypothetical protein
VALASALACLSTIISPFCAAARVRFGGQIGLTLLLTASLFSLVGVDQFGFRHIYLSDKSDTDLSTDTDDLSGRIVLFEAAAAAITAGGVQNKSDRLYDQ